MITNIVITLFISAYLLTVATFSQNTDIGLSPVYVIICNTMSRDSLSRENATDRLLEIAVYLNLEITTLRKKEPATDLILVKNLSKSF